MIKIAIKATMVKDRLILSVLKYQQTKKNRSCTVILTYYASGVSFKIKEWVAGLGHPVV